MITSLAGRGSVVVCDWNNDGRKDLILGMTFKDNVSSPYYDWPYQDGDTDKTDDEGFLGAIPNDHLSTPYRDRGQLEVTKGDWVVVDTKAFKTMLLEFDSKRLLDKYDDFVKYVNGNPKAPRRRDSNRSLAETVAKALADLKACVVAAATNDHALLFRMLPPPA